jgi:hypothetical protein
VSTGAAGPQPEADLGPWAPMTVTEAAELFQPAPFRWWISGGQAFELHVGRSWRVHGDTDVGIARQDVPELRAVLAGWDVCVAVSGQLVPWSGQPLTADLHQNNLWCRRTVGAAWEVDVTVSEGDGSCWIYRRNTRIRRPWGAAVLRTAEGIPYLAPELQLLFKSAGRRPKDDADAQEVIPQLGAEEREWLAQLLPAGHRWTHLLADRR